MPLGPYTLIEPIGAGGMGEVWKGLDTRLNRTVAIKRLKPGHSARFEQEARAIAALNHPHICQIYDVGPDYLVMEYIEGKPFGGPLPPEEAVRLAIQVVSALEDAHSKTILHRDLKPGNILVGAKGAKLLDFGLAKELSDTDATQTIEGMVMGTVPYMAPEQAEGKAVDVRSEVFSFGSVLYEVLSGRRAFDSLVAVARDEPAKLQAPDAVTRVVTKCLKKSPAERYQSMTELKTALQGIGKVEEVPSIAVLPFANMSADPEQEYFSDGLAEEIINALAQIPGLKVIARTSAFAFKGQNTDIRQIAEALGVAHVLEGSVRKAANRVRITAQLIAAKDGSHLWSERYDRSLDDIFAVQDEIATTIVGKLHGKLGMALPERHKHVPKLDAYEAYLKGQQHFFAGTPASFALAKTCYEQAIARDVAFALPHTGLGSLYIVLAGIGLMPAHQAMPLVPSVAAKALELDADLPEAHALLGTVCAAFDYDWTQAAKHYQAARAREPIPSYVRAVFAVRYLLPMGRLTEALAEADLALQEDPLAVPIHMIRVWCLLAAGRDSEVAAELDWLNQHCGNSPVMLSIRMVNHEFRGELEEARNTAELWQAAAPGTLGPLGWLAGFARREGDSAKAEGLLDRLRPGTAYGAPLALAGYHALLGEWEEVGRWLDAAFEQRDLAFCIIVFTAPQLRPFRASPYWPALRKKMNLPEGR